MARGFKVYEPGQVLDASPALAYARASDRKRGGSQPASKPIESSRRDDYGRFLRGGAVVFSGTMFSLVFRYSSASLADCLSGCVSGALSTKCCK